MGLPGRPHGSTTRPQIRDFLDEKKVKSLVKKAEAMARKGDSNMLKFLLEQVFGRAMQPIVGKDGEDLFPKPILDVIQPNNSNSQDNKPIQED